jgi:hypothetical protein
MPDVDDPAQGIGSLHEQLDWIEHLENIYERLQVSSRPT